VSITCFKTSFLYFNMLLWHWVPITIPYLQHTTNPFLSFHPRGLKNPDGSWKPSSLKTHPQQANPMAVPLQLHQRASQMHVNRKPWQMTGKSNCLSGDNHHICIHIAQSVSTQVLMVYTRYVKRVYSCTPGGFSEGLSFNSAAASHVHRGNARASPHRP
jgi:hypothetical protein